MYQRVREYIRENRMIGPGDMVIAGVSGGGDSMAMLAMLKRYQEEIPFSICVVHVNHGIRGAEADHDEELVKETCEKWGIPFQAYHYDVPGLARKRRIGEEEAGREARREAFQKTERILGAHAQAQVRIALAHNENDVAETLVHNLCRGTGLRGLASMQPVQGNIIRPVLCLKKQEIGDYLEKENIPFAMDSTNLSRDYTRNRIRHQILPLMEQEVNKRAVSHMAHTAYLAGQAEEYLTRQGEKLLEKYGKKEGSSLFLPREFWEDPVPASYGLLSAFGQLAGKRKDFTAGHVEEVSRLLERQVGRQICLPCNLTAKRTYGGILLSGKAEEGTSREKEPQEWLLPLPGTLACPLGTFYAKIFPYEKQKIEEKKYTKWIDYDKIKRNLSVRTRRTGDFLTLDGKGSHKKLNRCFIDEKIPSSMRDGIPLVAAGQEILWVVGGRISGNYKITPDTRRILELQYKGGKGIS